MMILYYLYTILPVHLIEVIPEDDYEARRPTATGEGTLELYDVPGEDDIIELGELFMLFYWKILPVDL